MLIGNGESKGNKLICETGSLWQGRRTEEKFFKRMKMEVGKLCGEIKMARKEAMGIMDMKFLSRKVALFSQGSNRTKSTEGKFSES